MRNLSNPCSMDYLSLSGSIEDHANNTSLIVQHLRKIVENLQYIYGMEMMHACQAVDLRRKFIGGSTLGRGTATAYEAFRKELALYENDSPLAPDIKKAYEFIKSGEFIKKVHERAK